MKKLYLLVAALMFFVLFQKTSSAQSFDEQSLILQTCIDLAEIQQYYPKNEDNSFKQLYILNFPVVFSVSLSVSKSNLPVLFSSREEIRNENPDAFLSFSHFDVTEESASIEFQFNHHRLTDSPGVINCNLTLVKESGVWLKSNLTLNNL